MASLKHGHAKGGTIAAVAGDPGGARALAPVLTELRHRGARVDVHAYRHAVGIFEERGLAPKPAAEDLSPVDAARCVEGADALLTATSMNDAMVELRFLEAAKRQGKPSLALLDFWTNYLPRFRASGDRLVLPDCIAVMDAQAAEEMAGSGLEAVRVVVTGQPAFDGLTFDYRDRVAQRSSRLREVAGVGASQPLVLFLGQPLRALYGDDLGVEGHPGYTERGAAEDLLKAVQEAGRDVRLVVRPHPRESVSDYDWLAADAQAVVCSQGILHEWMLCADVVVGMHTVALVEACYLGCVTLSYQPGLRWRDPLPTNRAGWSLPVSTREELVALVGSFLADEDLRARHEERLSSFVPDGQATRRVADLAEEMTSTRNGA